jgi:hypothetical protein
MHLTEEIYQLAITDFHIITPDRNRQSNGLKNYTTRNILRIVTADYLLISGANYKQTNKQTPQQH